MLNSRSRRGFLDQLWLIAIVGLYLAVPGTTRATELDLQTGVRWMPLAYTVPVGTGSESNADPQTSAVPGQWYQGGVLYGWENASFNSYLAFFFHERVGVQLSLDLGYSQHRNHTTDEGSFETSYFQFGFSVGGKYYILRPLREKVVPYVSANFYKYFASVSSDDPKVTDEVASALAGFHSPIGFDTAFGVEYFVSDGFSIGADVFGLRYGHVEGSISVNDITVSSKEDMFTLFTALSLNYRFRNVIKSSSTPGSTRRPPPPPKVVPPPPPAQPTDPAEIPPLDVSPDAID